MLIGILFAMHLQHDRMVASQRGWSLARIDIAMARAVIPEAERWGEAEGHGGRELLSSEGKVLGYGIQTAPDSDRFLGFSGPSNLLVVFTPDDRIAGVQVLESRDTRDHVELVRRDRRFFESWRGKTWSEAASRSEVDGVTGATLTSFAMAQGLQKRLGAKRVVAKFARPLEVADAQGFFPEAARIAPHGTVEGLWEVWGGADQRVGSILRTSPAADQIVGYQGPTEARLGIALDGRIVGFQVAESFDNEPYVGYVRKDAWFAKTVKKYSIQEWSELELAQVGIEGVSGATMTSMAVAEGVAVAAKRYSEERDAEEARDLESISGKWRAAGTAGLVGLGIVIGLTSWRGKPWVRLVFQVCVIVYLGFINADLLSLAMWVGWAQHGIPWRNALGLVVLAVAAVALPVVARTNVYCSHLCPHGAIQQWIPRRWKAERAMPRWLLRGLSAIRPLLLGWVILVAMLHWPFSLVDIEPFDAYAWRAAAWPTVAIAVLGIVASFRVPMAYCRFGCGTGAVLQYLRRNARSDRWTRADWFALLALAIGWLLYGVQRAG